MNYSSHVVRLSPEEIRIAVGHGLDRFISHTFDESGFIQLYGDAIQQSNILTCDIIGAIGELAACKYYGVYWSGSTSVGAPDAPGFEVRSTTYVNGHLRINQSDPDDLPYLLAIVATPTIRLVGWCFGKEGKRSEYWQGERKDKRGEFYYVPQDQLSLMEDFDEEFSQRQLSIHGSEECLEPRTAADVTAMIDDCWRKVVVWSGDDEL